MSTWSEDRRADKASAAEQRRKDEDARVDRLAKSRAAEDQRRRDNAAAGKAAKRAEKQQKRRDRRDRRRERAQAWTKNTTPAVIYRRGTLALVTASALASLPAQVAHFTAISMMLLPLPFALEGAAWVMAAGVAYADERHLPGWVRWMLRALCLSAAGFAAFVNYQYGLAEAPAAGYGLAAVSLLGPLFFEVRQWVTTLSASARTPQQKRDEKAHAKHAKRRKKDHKDVVALAERLISAAPFGTLAAEEAFRTASEIINGTSKSGMTPALYAQAARSRQALEQALAETGMSPEAIAIELFLDDVLGRTDGDDGPAGGTRPDAPGKGPRVPSGGNRRTGSDEPPEGATALGRKGKSPFGRRAPKTPDKPLAEADLVKVRTLAVALGGASNLTHSAVKKAVGGGANEYLAALRKAVQAETN
jgi:hypothetical protein